MCLCRASHPAHSEALQTRLGKLLPNWGQIGPERGEPAHPLSPRLCVVGRVGRARVCLEGWPPVWPEWSSQTLSPPSAAGEKPYLKHPHSPGTIAPMSLQWGARLKEKVGLPNPDVCLVSILLNFSDHSYKCQRTRLLAGAAVPRTCLLCALRQPCSVSASCPIR